MSYMNPPPAYPPRQSSDVIGIPYANGASNNTSGQSSAVSSHRINKAKAKNLKSSASSAMDSHRRRLSVLIPSANASLLSLKVKNGQSLQDMMAGDQSGKQAISPTERAPAVRSYASAGFAGSSALSPTNNYLQRPSYSTDHLHPTTNQHLPPRVPSYSSAASATSPTSASSLTAAFPATASRPPLSPYGSNAVSPTAQASNQQAWSTTTNQPQSQPDALNKTLPLSTMLNNDSDDDIDLSEPETDVEGYVPPPPPPPPPPAMPAAPQISNASTTIVGPNASPTSATLYDNQMQSHDSTVSHDIATPKAAPTPAMQALINSSTQPTTFYDPKPALRPYQPNQRLPPLQHDAHKHDALNHSELAPTPKFEAKRMADRPPALNTQAADMGLEALSPIKKPNHFRQKSLAKSPKGAGRPVHLSPTSAGRAKGNKPSHRKNNSSVSQMGFNSIRNPVTNEKMYWISGTDDADDMSPATLSSAAASPAIEPINASNRGTLPRSVSSPPSRRLLNQRRMLSKDDADGYDPEAMEDELWSKDHPELVEPLQQTRSRLQHTRNDSMDLALMSFAVPGPNQSRFLPNVDDQFKAQRQLQKAQYEAEQEKRRRSGGWTSGGLGALMALVPGTRQNTQKKLEKEQQKRASASASLVNSRAASRAASMPSSPIHGRNRASASWNMEQQAQFEQEFVMNIVPGSPHKQLSTTKRYPAPYINGQRWRSRCIASWWFILTVAFLALALAIVVLILWIWSYANPPAASAATANNFYNTYILATNSTSNATTTSHGTCTACNASAFQPTSTGGTTVHQFDSSSTSNTTTTSNGTTYITNDNTYNDYIYTYNTYYNGTSTDNVTISLNSHSQLQLADNGVSSAKLANGSVTVAKLDASVLTYIQQQHTSLQSTSGLTLNSGNQLAAAVQAPYLYIDSTSNQITLNSSAVSNLLPASVYTSYFYINATNSTNTSFIPDGSLSNRMYGNGSISLAKLGSDVLSYVSSQHTTVNSGSGITVDNTNPQAPIVNAKFDAVTINLSGSGALQVMPLSVGTGLLADTAVTRAKLGSIVNANSGLTQLTDHSLAVNVDNQYLIVSLSGTQPLTLNTSAVVNGLAGVGLQASGGSSPQLTIAFDNVTINTNSLKQLELADSGVTTSKLANSSVTLAKLGADVLTYFGSQHGNYTSGSGINIDYSNPQAAVVNAKYDGVTIGVNGASALQVLPLSIGSGLLTDSAVSRAKLGNVTNTASGLYQLADHSLAVNVDNQYLIINTASSTQPLTLNTSAVVSGLAGVGLQSSGGSSPQLTVAVDSVTITTNSNNQLQVADGGVSNTKLASNAVSFSKLDAYMQSISNLVTSDYNVTFQATTSGNSLTVGTNTADFVLNRPGSASFGHSTSLIGQSSTSSAGGDVIVQSGAGSSGANNGKVTLQATSNTYLTADGTANTITATAASTITVTSPLLNVAAPLQLHATSIPVASSPQTIDFANLAASTIKLTGASSPAGPIALAVANCNDNTAGMTVTVVNNLASSALLTLPSSACTNTISGSALLASTNEYLTLTCVGNSGQSTTAFCAKPYSSATSYTPASARGSLALATQGSGSIALNATSGLLIFNTNTTGFNQGQNWKFTFTNTAITISTIGMSISVISTGAASDVCVPAIVEQVASTGQLVITIRNIAQGNTFVSGISDIKLAFTLL